VEWGVFGVAFSFWDGLVIGVALAQVGVMVWLGYVLYRVKKGPVDDFVVKGGKIVLRANLLGLRGMQLFASNLSRGEGLVKQVKGIAEGVQYGTRTDFGDRISYKSLLASWLSLQTSLATAAAAFGLVKGIGGRLFGGKTVSPATARRNPPPGPPRRSLLDRMGLVAPAMKPLGRLLQYLPLGLEIYREARRRLR
jgi:hypothetical protein